MKTKTIKRLTRRKIRARLIEKAKANARKFADEMARKFWA